jgi:hypothetical protein
MIIGQLFGSKFETQPKKTPTSTHNHQKTGREHHLGRRSRKSHVPARKGVDRHEGIAIIAPPHFRAKSSE